MKKLPPTAALALIACVAAAHAQDKDPDALPADLPSSSQHSTPQEGSSPGSTSSTETSLAQPAPEDSSASTTPSSSTPETGDSVAPGATAQDSSEPESTAAAPPPPEEQAPDAMPPPREFEEIIVTATKTQASMRDVPVSIQAMKGDDLLQQGKTTLDDILKDTPAVNKTNGQVTIRGVGMTTDTTVASGEETGYFLGEATLMAPSLASALPDFDPYDLSTVEILEGPQSTLFGGTALAGAIRYMPNKPEFGVFSGGARGSYGWFAHAEHAYRDASVMLNVPIGESFALRGAGTWRDKPNITKDTRGDRDNLDSADLRQGRLMARWGITDRLSADLVYMHYVSRTHLTFLDNPDRYESSYTRFGESTDDKLDVGSLSLTYTFDSFALTGVVNTLRNHLYTPVDGAPVLGLSDLGEVPSRVRGNAKVPSYELRVVSDRPTEGNWWLFNDWDYIVGLYYMTADQRAEQTTSAKVSLLELIGFPVPDPLPGDPEVVIAGTRSAVDLSEKAVYVNLTRHLFDERLEFNLGARFAKTLMDAVGAQTAGGLNRADNHVRDPDQRINPKVALTWHFNDDVNLRASMSEGFRFGGANNAITIGVEDIPPFFKSDSLRNYEVGLRSDWLDRTLRFDVTGFHIDWQDMQIYQNSPAAQGYTSNVGSAVIDGIESSFTWRLPSDWPLVPEGLTLNSGFTYIKARTADAFNSANGEVPSGTRLPLSPKEAATLGLAWDGQWGNWLLNSTVQASYAGSRTNMLNNDYTFDSYTTLSASLRVANPNWPGAPAITLAGVNLTDEFIPVLAFPKTADPTQHVFLAQGPRAIKLSLEMSFGKN